MAPINPIRLNLSAGLVSVVVAGILVVLKLWALGETGALSVAASLADSAMDLMVSIGAAAAMIYAARRVCGALERVVVETDENPVGRGMQVGLEIANPQIHGALESDHRVLGPQQPASSVGHGDRGLLPEEGFHPTTTLPSLTTFQVWERSGRYARSR